MRYFLVESLTGAVFALCWLSFGHLSLPLVLSDCVLISGLIAATCIDFEHIIIPDEITIGGMVAGLILAFFAPVSHLTFPLFQPMRSPTAAMRDSVLGMIIGAGVVYAILRLGKLLFGRYKIALPPGSRIFFTETSLKLPAEDMPYEELFYRAGDIIRLEAERVELIDRCYGKVEVRLQPKQLRIGQDTFEPEKVLFLEAITDHVVLPREAMGLGDVKFMAAIGAFLGWPAVLFSLALSSVIGSLAGVALILLRKRDWSARLLPSAHPLVRFRIASTCSRSADSPTRAARAVGRRARCRSSRAGASRSRAGTGGPGCAACSIHSVPSSASASTVRGRARRWGRRGACRCPRGAAARGRRAVRSGSPRPARRRRPPDRCRRPGRLRLRAGPSAASR